MKISQKILSSILVLSTLLLIAKPALADEEIKKLTVDLKAKGFADTVWQDSLDSTKVIFGPTNQFQYQIIVKNEGNRNQTWINVNTLVPSTVTTSEAMSFKIPQLTPNEEYIKTFTLTIKDKAYINQEITKNMVITAVKSESGLTGSDKSYFYTNNGTKNIVATTSAQTLPDSGMPILLVSLVGSGIAGFGLLARRYARGY